VQLFARGVVLLSQIYEIQLALESVGHWSPLGSGEMERKESLAGGEQTRASCHGLFHLEGTQQQVF